MNLRLNLCGLPIHICKIVKFKSLVKLYEYGVCALYGKFDALAKISQACFFGPSIFFVSYCGYI